SSDLGTHFSGARAVDPWIPALRRDDDVGHFPSRPWLRYHVFFALSRNTNFWILPVEVFGSGPKTTWRGALNRAMRSRQKAMISPGSAAAPSFSVTKAQGVSPQFGSGFATTAASSTAGCRYRTSSTSIVEMFSPPEMMMSFERSLIST